jgi:hypothetical protein
LRHFQKKQIISKALAVKDPRRTPRVTSLESRFYPQVIEVKGRITDFQRKFVILETQKS